MDLDIRPTSTETGNVETQQAVIGLTCIFYNKAPCQHDGTEG